MASELSWTIYPLASEPRQQLSTALSRARENAIKADMLYAHLIELRTQREKQQVIETQAHAEYDAHIKVTLADIIKTLEKSVE
jgi:hypothetical protein